MAGILVVYDAVAVDDLGARARFVVSVSRSRMRDRDLERWNKQGRRLDFACFFFWSFCFVWRRLWGREILVGRTSVYFVVNGRA